jgi:Holliday junction resolvasome RuvABC endonuclease subunit
MTSETVAQDLRAKIADQVATKGKMRTSKKVWTPPAPEDFAHGRVLAFDQALSKTGFSVVVSDYTGLSIIEGNVILPEDKPDISSFELTLHKAESMGRQFEALMLLLGSTIDVAVHEMSSVHGYRIESSLMAAREVRRAANNARVKVVMVQNQSMRAMLNPPHERSEKKYVKSAIEAMISEERRHPKRWTQDVADSVGLALTYLHQKNSWSDHE